MPQIVPLVSTPNQTEVFSTGNQSCQVIVYTLEPSGVPQLYIDVYLNNDEVILGVVCQDRNRIVRNAYLGFPGELVFFDTQGVEDPEYTGLGVRWQLVYFDSDEVEVALAAAGLGD